MGFDLFGAKSSYSTNNSGWYYLLETAKGYGWQPQGTIIRYGVFPSQDEKGSGDDWCGWYTSNDWQFVTEDDAKALGRALLRAASDLKQRHRPRHLRLVGRRKPDLALSTFADDDPDPEWIERFAAFALEGEFQIG